MTTVNHTEVFAVALSLVKDRAVLFVLQSLDQNFDK